MKAIWGRRTRKRWWPVTDTKKVTVRNSSVSDIDTTRCDIRDEHVFGLPSMKITGAELVK